MKRLITGLVAVIVWTFANMAAPAATAAADFNLQVPVELNNLPLMQYEAYNLGAPPVVLSYQKVYGLRIELLDEKRAVLHTVYKLLPVQETQGKGPKYGKKMVVDLDCVATVPVSFDMPAALKDRKKDVAGYSVELVLTNEYTPFEYAENAEEWWKKNVPSKYVPGQKIQTTGRFDGRPWPPFKVTK